MKWRVTGGEQCQERADSLQPTVGKIGMTGWGCPPLFCGVISKERSCRRAFWIDVKGKGLGKREREFKV
jgi:hypothetical protein